MIGDVIGVIGYKSRGTRRKEEDIVGGTGKDADKKGGICAPRFTL